MKNFMPKENPYLIFTDIYHTPGSAMEVLESFSDQAEIAQILKRQIYVLQGKVDEIYDTEQRYLGLGGVPCKGFYEAISVGTLLSKCAIWKGARQTHE